LGQILVDSNGMTLYVNKNDSATTSACTDACAQNWPPLVSTSDQETTLDQGVSGQLGQLARADGTIQVTFNGMPLYYYKGDHNPGEASGQGIGGMWSVVVLGGGSPSGSGTPTAPGAGSTTTP
jgi:predicted lipoprotein with Yx(FWY)xxD motif